MKYLLTSHLDGSMQPWGVFDTEEAAMAFALQSEREDAQADEDELKDATDKLNEEQLETHLPFRRCLSWNDKVMRVAEGDETYSGASWTVIPVHENPANCGEVLS